MYGNSPIKCQDLADLRPFGGVCASLSDAECSVHRVGKTVCHLVPGTGCRRDFNASHRCLDQLSGNWTTTLNTQALIGPSAKLSPHVHIPPLKQQQQPPQLPLPPSPPPQQQQRARSARTAAAPSLVLVAAVMQFELCYVAEWVEYHLQRCGEAR
jgi:hypothetical protein